MVYLYSLTLLLSACLLFVVQPMMGKMMLPFLGGAPAVWSNDFSNIPSVLRWR